MSQDDFPAPQAGSVVTHFLVVSDQDRSGEFYRSVFGARVLLERDPVILRPANSWLILNVGGGPTDDKPTVTLTTPPDPNQASAFLNLRVADIAAAYGRLVGQRRQIPHRTQTSRQRNPRLHPRPRRAPDRGRAVHRRAGLVSAAPAPARQAH
jgi:catechol 2,3-dioxygenase-like lactoylglutathione lyase family enzyme